MQRMGTREIDICQLTPQQTRNLHQVKNRVHLIIIKKVPSLVHNEPLANFIIFHA